MMHFKLFLIFRLSVPVYMKKVEKTNSYFWQKRWCYNGISDIGDFMREDYQTAF